MTTRKYSSRSQQTTLAAGITDTATTCTVVSGSALLGGATVPAGTTFTVVIDPDTALEEIVDVTAVSTNVLTIARGVENAGTGQAHSAGAAVRHMAIGRDFRESNLHIEATGAYNDGTGSHAMHGIVSGEGDVVGTAKAQALTQKTISGSANTITNIGTTSLVDSAVTTAKIADSAVTSAKIADLTIATGDIADSAITSGKIATGAVGTVKIDDLSITTAKVVDSAITAAKIGTDAVTTAKIQDGAVTTGKIADGTIVNADINASAAIDKTKISGTAITAGDTGTVTSMMIADGAVVNADINSSAQIAYSKLNLTNTIVDADINASAAITATKVAGTAVTQADTGTVTSAMIANGTIVNADINASAAIALSKLAVDPLARANHTGTQTASTISDFDTQVRTSKVTDLAAPTGSFPMNSQKITNLLDPTSAQDAATKAYADTMIPATEKGANNGVATLGSDGKLTTGQIPDVTITDTFVVASEAAMLALTAQVGDVAVRTDVNKTFILKTAGATVLANWQELLTPTDSVLSVDGQTGVVNLSSTYATVANAANKLPLAGGTMTGAIAMGTNKITGLGTPSATDDAATKAYADGKLALTGGTLTGVLAMSANKITNLADPTDLTDAMTLNYFNTAALAPSNLTGPITSIGPATAVASQTGTGSKFVMDNTPTLITPVLGVATATSINGTTIPTSKTLVATDSTQYVVPSQSGNNGKYLTTDGTTSSWGTISGYSAPIIGTTSIASGATVTTIDGLALTASSIDMDNDSTVGLGAKLRVYGDLYLSGANTKLRADGSDGTNNQVLTATGTGVKWAAPKVSCTYSAKTAAYTFASGDESNMFSMNNASSVQFNIPTDATFNFAVGTEFNVFWITGAGQPTIGAATPGTTTVISTGATSATPKLRVANSGATIKKIAANSWIVFGDLA